MVLQNMKNHLNSSKESTQAHVLVNDTLKQLEAAKRTIEFLRTDAAKERESCPISTNSKNKCSFCRNLADENANQIETEIHSLRSEVGLLRSAIEIAETKYQEEQIQNMVKMEKAYELIEQMKLESNQRESELERKKAEIEELKAKLINKEFDFQGIVGENERLSLKILNSMSPQREFELKKELKMLDQCVAELKGDLMEKETTLQNISVENEMLKMEINKRFTRTHVDMVREEVAAELKAAKAAEQDALMKFESVAEKLEAAEAVNSEKEAELRRLKVQCDQWRKAAETAAALISVGNIGQLPERSMSFDSSYSNAPKNKYSSLSDEFDDDFLFQRKKNGNVLKKIGVLWKKPQKVTA